MLRERVDGLPEVLRAPEEVGTHEQVQDLLRRCVGAGEQEIDKPLDFREPVQGPRLSSVSQSRARDEPSSELRRAPNNTPAIAMAKIRNPELFSEHFGVPTEDLARLPESTPDPDETIAAPEKALSDAGRKIVEKQLTCR